MVENFRQAQQQKSVDARTGKDVVHISADTVKLPRQPHNCVPSGVVSKLPCIMEPMWIMMPGAYELVVKKSE